MNWTEGKALTRMWKCFLAVEWVMDWAAISPTPHKIPELMTWVFTGWTAKQFWYHFHTFIIIISPKNEKEKRRDFLITSYTKKCNSYTVMCQYGGGGLCRFFSPVDWGPGKGMRGLNTSEIYIGRILKIYNQFIFFSFPLSFHFCIWLNNGV